MYILLNTPQEVQQDIANRFKARRLAMNLTQEELAKRAGVSWGSLKRFEREGLIALDALLRISLVLDCLNDFESLAVDNRRTPLGRSLDSILATPATRRRATSRKAASHGL